MIKHSQITQSNKFAISLQHLKKEVRNGGHFGHADKRQSFYKLVLSFLVEVATHVQNTQNKKLVKMLRKNCRNCFVFYYDAKHSDILQEPVMFVVTCFPSNMLDFTNQNIITKKTFPGKKMEIVINVTKHPSSFPV